MKIVYFGNNRLGHAVLKWLKDHDEAVVGLVVHPERRRKYADEMIRYSGLQPPFVLDGAMMCGGDALQTIQSLRPDIGVSVMFGYILPPALLELFPLGVINLHIAYLPYNRGAYPNVWSIIDGTPAGVTIHYMDSGVDTGDIIARREVAVEPVDTGESLYHKLEAAGEKLFAEVWPLIRTQTAPRAPQETKLATHHKTNDVDRIDLLDLERRYSARELIDIIRARTFRSYRGVYFQTKDGRRVFLRLDLSYDDGPDQQ